MTDYGRRLVIDMEFDRALAEATRAVRQEGMQIVARMDVRDRFWQDLGHDFRRYMLIEAWSPELALEALRNSLDIGAILPTTFAVYELADGETAVVAREPLLPLSSNVEWRRDAPALAAMADLEAERVARVFATVQHAAMPHPVPSAA